MNGNKWIKRFAVLLLVLPVFLFSGVWTFASGDKDKNKVQVADVNIATKVESSGSNALYDQLISSGTEAKPISGELTDAASASKVYNELKKEEIEEGRKIITDWASSYVPDIGQAAIDNSYQEKIDQAIHNSKHIWKGRKDYYKVRDGYLKEAEDIKVKQNKASIITSVCDAVMTAWESLHLQGETAEDQIWEVAILTAKFAIDAFAVIDIAISFPWSLILALLLDVLLDLARNGTLSDLWNAAWNLLESFFYKLQDGTNVYKPNIYIYSKKERKVAVTFGKPELLTTVIPEYPGGWSVTADADGTLTNASGETYGYLFYESVTDPSLFQTEEGWRIPAQTRKESFEKILTELGFSEREIADFTEFWVEKLDAGVDYIMYPQNTALVDEAMPMTVTETPESLERIWFAFAADDGRDVIWAEGYELSRGGADCAYYVIEWGGLIL